jgi:phosphopantothenoylcysteine synthetase/decarboxylase
MTPESVNKPIFELLDRFITDMSVLEGRFPSGKEKELFSATLARLKQMRPEAEVQLIAAMNAVQSQVEAHQSHLKKLSQQLTEVEGRIHAAAETAKERAAARAAQAAQAATNLPTPPMPPAMDPKLGERLREELLQLVRPANSTNSPTAPGQDLWEDWK